MLLRLNQMPGNHPDPTLRLDRPQAILTEWFGPQLAENCGTWEPEKGDLGDFGPLPDFLSRCSRQPTPTERGQFVE